MTHRSPRILARMKRRRRRITTYRHLLALHQGLVIAKYYFVESATRKRKLICFHDEADHLGTPTESMISGACGFALPLFKPHPLYKKGGRDFLLKGAR